MVIGIIGLGLIGGSIAKEIKNKGFAKSIIGYNRSKKNCENALKMNLIDHIVDFKKLCNNSDLIILAIPVNSIRKILPKVLNLIANTTVVTDVGSTKELIIESIKNHPKKKRFVPSHPMSGTEKSGPTAAISNLFLNKVTIICNQNCCDKDALELVVNLYKKLGSHLIFMNSKDHDEYIGYVSHLCHIISYALAITVLEKEKKTSNIFNLASSGLNSTVRLAKSSPDIWTPIFEQNTKNILEIIDIYIKKIEEFKNYLQNKDFNKIYQYITKANKIKKILKNK